MKSKTAKIFHQPTAGAAPRYSQGFTLIEVMVALVIFAICATSMHYVLSQSIASYTQIERKTFAGWIAENKLAELRLKPKMPAIGEQKDELEYANLEWITETKVTGTQDPNMRRIDVTVEMRIPNSLETQSITSMTGFIGKN